MWECLEVFATPPERWCLSLFLKSKQCYVPMSIKSVVVVTLCVSETKICGVCIFLTPSLSELSYQKPGEAIMLWGSAVLYKWGHEPHKPHVVLVECETKKWQNHQSGPVPADTTKQVNCTGPAHSIELWGARYTNLGLLPEARHPPHLSMIILKITRKRCVPCLSLANWQTKQ